MLITKKPEAGDLIAIKIVTGEEIVGRIAEDASANPGDIALKAPVGWMLTQQGVMPAPFMVTAEDKPTVVFAGQTIIARTVPRKEIADAYIQITSNIVVPGSAAAPGAGMFTKG